MKTNVHFLITFRPILLRVRCFTQKLSGKSKHILRSETFLFWKSFRLRDRRNVVKYGTARQATDGNIIWCMPIACWIPKATDTQWEYVIIIAFPLQRRLHERAWMLRYTYNDCLVPSETCPPSPPATGINSIRISSITSCLLRTRWCTLSYLTSKLYTFQHTEFPYKNFSPAVWLHVWKPPRMAKLYIARPTRFWYWGC